MEFADHLKPLLSRSEGKLYGCFGADDWQALLDAVWTVAVNHLKRGGEVDETFVLMRDRFGRRAAQATATSFMHDTPRQLQLGLLANVLRKMQGLAYLSISEAWFMTAPPEAFSDPAKRPKWGSIAQRPDRQESLVACLVARDGTKLSRIGDIVRLGGVPGEGLCDRIEMRPDTSLFAGDLFTLFERKPI